MVNKSEKCTNTFFSLCWDDFNTQGGIWNITYTNYWGKTSVYFGQWESGECLRNTCTSKKAKSLSLKAVGKRIWWFLIIRLGFGQVPVLWSTNFQLSNSLLACTRQFYKLSFGCSVRCVVCPSLSKLTNQVLQAPNTLTTDRVWRANATIKGKVPCVMRLTVLLERSLCSSEAVDLF